MKKITAILSAIAIAIGLLVAGPTAAHAVLKTQSGQVSVAGNPIVGGTLIASVSGLKSGSSVKYTWKVDGTTKATGDSLYLGEDEYSGATIQLYISAKKSGYKDWKYTSPNIVEGKVTQLKAPTISGSLKSGQRIEANCGTSLPQLNSIDGGVSECSVQWQGNGIDIEGANQTTFDLTTSQIGMRISALITISAQNLESSIVSVSKSGSVIGTFEVTSDPTFTTDSLVGDTISFNEYPSWNTEPTSVKYQWYRSGKKISGATSSYYTLKSDDWHKSISVKISAAKASYETKSVSFRALDYVYKISTKSGATWSGYDAWDSCDYDYYSSYDCWRNSKNKNWVSAWNEEDFDDDYTSMNLSANAPTFSGQVIGWRAVFTGSLGAAVLVLNSTGDGIQFTDGDSSQFYNSGSTWRSGWTNLPIYSGSQTYAAIFVSQYGGFTVKSMKIEVQYIH